MGLWDRISTKFRGRSDADAVHEKLSHFLNSDAAQNAAIPDDIKAILDVGGSVDALPGSTGAFGLSVSNPIPVNGPVGEVTYLSSLKLNDGRGIWAHRLGSKDRIDIFEVVSEDGKDWCLLFLSPYHTRKSTLSPSGFRFNDQPRVRGIFATNQYVANFPHHLHDAIRQWSMVTLGIPLVSPNLRSAIQSVSFQRPPQHIAAMEALDNHGRTTNAVDAHYLLLQGFTDEKLMPPFIAVLRKNIGYEAFDENEIAVFCASLVTYCYLRYGPRRTDHEMLDAFHRMIVSDIATAGLPRSHALDLYQTRYREYSALLGPVLDQSTDQRHHMTTLMMHACERATHTSARGHMIKIAASSSVIAALLDDAIKFARQLAHSRPDFD